MSPVRKPATVTRGSMQPLLLLCTGTSVAVLGQYVNNQAAIDAKAQLLVLARYVFTFAVSALLCARQSNPAGKNETSSTSVHTSGSALNKQEQCSRRAVPLTAGLPNRTLMLLVVMGMLDLASYAIFNLGFAVCGSALASLVLAAAGQICTALVSVTALHRKLTVRHVTAVTIVTVGLILRSADDINVSKIGGSWRPAASGASSSMSTSTAPSTLYGVLCVMLSALLFSVLGCMYELLMNAEGGSSVTQAQASAVVTAVSLLATCAHQLLYTLPNTDRFILQPVAASPYSPTSIVASHIAYGMVTAAHQYVQVSVLGSHGAMAVGLVNAVRASVVSFVSSWLFCGSVSHLCLTHWRAISALVVTAGASLWVMAGKPFTSKQVQQAKKHEE